MPSTLNIAIGPWFYVMLPKVSQAYLGQCTVDDHIISFIYMTRFNVVLLCDVVCGSKAKGCQLFNPKQPALS